ncbi:MAG: TlpA disulfide reductase family protein [Candidatus Latescibacteria bacterium]|nr:TlpA disulfide reductase family protein [Candidatus Latescibacterota bacterium]
MKRAVFVFPLLLALLVAALPAAAGLDGPRVPTPTALDLKPYAGRVVYVDFWASWCQPCRSSFPWLNELQKKYGERGLTVLMVNEDHDRKAAETFLAELGGDLQIIWDVGNKFALAYELQAMPSSFLIGRDGRLRTSHVGFDPKQTAAVEAEIEALLAEGAPDATAK